MSSRGIRAAYEARMHRVLGHIDQHLDEPLDLATLAEVAHFSPFHFHRLFAAWMGERLGDYLRRRRLETAAMRLAAQPSVSVLGIALAVGFGSAEAFARAFKDRFGCSPTSWRAQQAQQRVAKSKFDQTHRKIDQEALSALANHGTARNPQQDVTMNVMLINREPATVAYLRHLGAYGEPLFGFWTETVYPWLAANHLLEQARYGISYDDPSITAPDQCRYDACVEVPSDFVATGKALKTTIPGGKYAVLPFKGPVAEVGEAWSALLRDWLPSSGLQLDARPCFEFYPKGATYDTASGAFECEICIPVAPL